MRKTSKILSILLVVAMILPGIAQSAPLTEKEIITRLSGDDRVKTAIEVSKELYKTGSESVVLAGFNGEVDALTGTLLAADKNAPLLVTRQAKLTNETRIEIKRLKAKTIYILGGEKVVSQAVETELKGLVDSVVRVEGSGREDTAAKVAGMVNGGQSNHVFLALGRMPVITDALADALAIGPVSAMKKAPVLLTKKDSVPAETTKAMKDLGVTHVTIVGGTTAISPSLQTMLEKTYTVNRVAGDSRENTALAIADEYFSSPENLIVAYGRSSADALVGGYVGAKMNAPILLTNKFGLTDKTKTYIEANPLNTFVLGGTSVISEEIFKSIKETLNSNIKLDIIVKENIKLSRDYNTIKVTGNDIIVDLNGKTVQTLTVSANDTTIKNGKVVNLNIEKDVNNVTLEDILDDENGEHNFAGGGANSIVLKGKTNLKGTVSITSATPIQIRAEGLMSGNGIAGKIIVDTDKPVTIAVPAEEIEVIKENKSITIKAEVTKIVALADVEIEVSEGITIPVLNKAPGVEASVTDINGKEQEFTENENLKPVDPTPTPEPEVPSTGGGSGGSNPRPVVEAKIISISVDGKKVIDNKLKLYKDTAVKTIEVKFDKAITEESANTIKGLMYTDSKDKKVVFQAVPKLTEDRKILTVTLNDGVTTATEGNFTLSLVNDTTKEAAAVKLKDGKDKEVKLNTIALSVVEQDSFLTGGQDLTLEDSTYKTSFNWGSNNGIGTEISKHKSPGEYSYFENGAYLDITIKKDKEESNSKFDDVLSQLTLQTDEGNVDDISGGDKTDGRQPADWGKTDAKHIGTKLKLNGSNSVFYGVRQNSTNGVATVGFKAGESRKINLTVTPKDDLENGNYTITVQLKQQVSETEGKDLDKAITYSFIIGTPAEALARLLGENNSIVNGTEVTLLRDINLAKDIIVPTGVTLNTDGKKITNNNSMVVEGNLKITDTNQLAGSGAYKISNKGKLMLGETNYIAKEGAIVTVNGEVSLSRNVDGGYVFDIPAEVTATIKGRNSSSADYYHHGAHDVINVRGTLVIDKRFANHGTIKINDSGTLTLNENIFAAPSNDTGKLILGSNVTLTGSGKLEGNPVVEIKELENNSQLKWNEITWEKLTESAE